MSYIMKKLNIEKHVTTAADKVALEAAGYKLVAQPPAEQPAVPEQQPESEPSEAVDKPVKQKLNIEKHVTTAADKVALEAAGYKPVAQSPAEQSAVPEQQPESEPSEAVDKPVKRRGGAVK